MLHRFRRRNLLITLGSGLTAMMLAITGFSLDRPEPLQANDANRALVRSPHPALPQDLRLPEPNPTLRNPWPADWEADFQDRARAVIEHFGNAKSYGNGYGENEKTFYPLAMFDFLAGNRQRAIAALQAEDPQIANHEHTAGIDYYYAFTLKGQMRKYFLFGPFLDPAYRQRMWQGAQAWTAQDPLTRPHPLYGEGNNKGQDWDIKRRGYWVDSRNTDNLRAMREVAVYLMAETAGNEAVRQQYQQKLERYVSALYHIGMGEWDSSTYHGHTFAAYLNLYDFAQDPAVQQLAKAALDWLSTAAAVKYYRGGWGGPSKRDYGDSNQLYGGSSARTFWLYFGDNHLPNPAPEKDLLHFITSPYRPPAAVVALAQKDFPKPVEILSSKPLYENWKPGYDRAPGYWETTYIGHTFQLGSLAGPFADGDVLPFKLMVSDRKKGVEMFVANTGKRRVRPGKRAGDQIGQFQNLLLWLRPDSGGPFAFQLPQSALVEEEQGLWFIQFEETWLALSPIHLQLTATEIPLSQKQQQLYPDTRLLNAQIQNAEIQGDHAPGDRLAGFAIEIGEAATHDNFSQFKQQVLKQSKLDLAQLPQGVVRWRGSQGKILQLTYNFDYLLPKLKRNGDLFRWSEHFALYQSYPSSNARGLQDDAAGPIHLGWKQGQLRVSAGAESFQSGVSASGQVQVISVP